MEETTIVLMQKNKENGQFEKELGCYTITTNTTVLSQVYAQIEQQQTIVHLFLTCEKELEDWEYEAVFDYYDTETISSFVNNIEEVDGQYLPVWHMTFLYIDEQTSMQKRFADILEAHIQELDSVYEAIADKKDEYIEQ